MLVVLAVENVSGEARVRGVRTGVDNVSGKTDPGLEVEEGE